MKPIKVLVTVIVLIGVLDPSYGQPPEPYGSPMFQPPLPPSSMQYRSYGRVWVEKGMAQDGYKLYVHTSKDIDPRSIQVSIVGRTVIIESKQSFQQEERNDRGIYSYSRSSTNFRRRFSIPRNADTENMSRTESGGVITITLPFLHPNPNYQ